MGVRRLLQLAWSAMSDQQALHDARRVAPLVSGERLAFARELRGWTQRDVAERLGELDRSISTPALSQFETGRTRPAPETLAALCAIYDCPPDFFIERPGDEIRKGFFRSLTATPARDRKLYIARTRLLSSFVRVLEDHVVLPAVDVPRVLVDLDDDYGTELEAARVREYWGVPSGPVDNMVRLLELHGVVVVRPQQFENAIDAFSVRYEQRPLVALSSGKNLASRSRFDAAHELAHLVMHDDEVAGTSAAERHAHRFAAAFLMPEADIAAELPATADLARLMDLKAKWRVSMGALLMRAKTLGIMSPERYTSAMKMFSARGWRRREPGDDLLGAVEAPQLLNRALSLVQENEGLTVRDLCREGALPCEEIQQILSRAEDSRPVVQL
jgi:Zn-dependent peptidase ImmA (M78 family)/transcriptional regulator with XRE-family HTH domain